MLASEPLSAGHSVGGIQLLYINLNHRKEKGARVKGPKPMYIDMVPMITTIPYCEG